MRSGRSPRTISTTRRACSPNVTGGIATAEPLLPADVDFRAEVEALYGQDGAGGALADGAYVLGFSRAEDRWGPNVWVEAAGHAAATPSGCATSTPRPRAGWVERGLKAHYAVVPAGDPALVDAWFRLGFGAQQALGIVEVPDVEWPAGVREARAEDVDALVAIAPLLQQHQWQSPVFSVRAAAGRRGRTGNRSSRTPSATTSAISSSSATAGSSPTSSSAPVALARCTLRSREPTARRTSRSRSPIRDARGAEPASR